MGSNQAAGHVEQSLSDTVYERLRGDLILCRLRPGHEINAAEIASRYGAGRTPVREALIRLMHEGYVTVQPRKGYRVAPVRLSDVAHTFQVRLLLEPPAAELAAQRRTDAQARDIARLAETVDRAPSQPDLAAQDAAPADRWSVNSAFHLAIASSAGNPRLLHIVRALLQDVERLYRLGLALGESDQWGRRHNRHRELAAAIAERDDQRARQIMTDALLLSRARLMDAIHDGVDPARDPAAPMTLGHQPNVE